jgi:hypothetical protein
MIAGLSRATGDRIVVRFVGDALVMAELTVPEGADSLRHGAARLVEVEATDLDHAIWRCASGRPVLRDPDDERDVMLEEAE